MGCPSAIIGQSYFEFSFFWGGGIEENIHTPISKYTGHNSTFMNEKMKLVLFMKIISHFI